MGNNEHIEKLYLPQEIGPDERIIISKLLVQNGHKVSINQPILEIETSKAVYEVVAHRAGEIKINLVEGQEIGYGVVLGEIGDNFENYDIEQIQNKPQTVKFTKSAREELVKLGIDLSIAENTFRDLNIITSENVRQAFSEFYIESKQIGNSAKLDEFDTFILGFGHRGQALRSFLIKQNSSRKIAFIDYKRYSQSKIAVLESNFVFPFETVYQLLNRIDCSFYWCIPNTEDVDFQKQTFNILAGKLLNFISPIAEINTNLESTVGLSVYPFSLSFGIKIGNCVTIENNVIIGTNAKVGNFSTLSNGASLAHDSVLGEFCSVSDGARIAGRVEVGDNTLIGLNSTINMDITIGSNVVINSGANVYKDVPDFSIVKNTGEVVSRMRKY